MSSLRLALKQSRIEAIATGAGNSSSEENEFHGEIDTENGGQRHEEKNDNWKVTPPSEALCQRAATLGTATRDYVVVGLRVKVQFDGKYWYGGRIARVAKDACRIRILYDDGSKEVSRFPDGVIVDATDNGKHDESVLENAKYFMGDDFDESKIVANKKRQQQLLQQQQLQQPATPKPEKTIELSKTMSDATNPSPVSTKLSIATPKLSDVAASSSAITVAATPKSPTPGTPGVIKRKRGRPRKHPLPEGTEVTPRSPHIPKKKSNIEAKKPLTIKIPGPNKVKQSLQQQQTPKDHDTTTASTPKKPSQSPRVGKKMKPKRSATEDTTNTAVDHENRHNNKNPKKRPTDDIMWIQCDACSKWRIVPKSVDTNEKWYCRDNIYDPKRASCDVPEQASKPKKKRQRIEEDDIPRLAPMTRPEESRTPTEDETTRHRAAKRARELVENPVVVVKRGRGRPRRNTKETTTTNIKTDDAAESADNLEWVQCETCGKWRKIAPHISATDLPEVWTCEMNDWNPASASCDAPEDKADGLQDTGVFGTSGSTGEDKMTYRHLIFGSTGRRVNRPVSERTRAAESIFSVQFDDEDVPSRVLYADSSAFVSRGRSNLQDADNRVSVLQLMSKSNLWKELQAASKSIASNGALSRKNPPHLSVYSYENLPRDIQQAMKELVLFLLSYESYSVEEIVQNGRTSQDIPEGCRKAQVALTEQVVCTTLYQLVKEGKVECVEKQGTTAQCYRLFLANRSQCRRMASRCLKIAKPWKRPHST